MQEIRKPSAPTDRLPNRRLIDDDKSVSENYQRLVYDTASALYDEKNDEMIVRALREKLIGEIRQSMRNVFDDLLLQNISNPFGPDSSGAFFFEKGAVKSYHYKNLSGGEKAAFDLLLDLHLKKDYFTDAIYCVDEVEAHLHTGVQGVLVREMASIIPDDSQLWVTTHSLGVLRAAQEIESGCPGSVCIINFDGVAPDIPCKLSPTTLDRVSWEKMLSIALDDLSERVAPEFIVVCEGSSIGNRRKDFDASIYERILGKCEAGFVFVSGGNSQQLTGTAGYIHDILSRILPQTKVVALADRDDKSEEQVAQYDGITLAERNIESYLLADDVIDALLQREGKPELRDQALEIKANALANSINRGNTRDDLKSAAGEIYIGLKQLIGLQRSGDNKDAFMKDTLAPLIVPGMTTYQKLKSDIVDKIKSQ